MTMTGLTKTLVGAACALPLALLGTVVYVLASELIGVEGTCEEPEGVHRLAQVSAVPTPPAPPGATVVPGGSGAECLDDSGTEVWLTAWTSYAYDGTPEQVVDHYGTAARTAGWQPPESRPKTIPGLLLDDVCFRKEVDGHPTLLSVTQSGRHEYAVTVNAVLDGSHPTC
ncbi:hypothetical protein BSL84_10490 [Streptomyces sp. TN58]|nr:hypothetical protein BSL84_10490 [Streptomyces sp. TN58]